ncbi:hypothetical protein HN51_059767 [Arachis hypogaea]
MSLQCLILIERRKADKPAPAGTSRIDQFFRKPEVQVALVADPEAEAPAKEERNKVLLYDQPWKKKKVQSQVAVERDNMYASRPSTSSRRIPNKSCNGGLDSPMPVNRRPPISIYQFGSNSINSGNQAISFINDGRKMQRRKMFGESGIPPHSRDEASPVISTHSRPFSP